MNASEKNPEIEEAPVQTGAETAEENEAEAKDLKEESDVPNETEESKSQEIDYAALAREDMRELIALFPHLSGKESVAELENPLRYAALRDLGLSPKEAYLATGGYQPKYDNRSHLRSAVPRAASSSDAMLDTRSLEACRELFAGLSDSEIQRLYKKVSR